MAFAASARRISGGQGDEIAGLLHFVPLEVIDEQTISGADAAGVGAVFPAVVRVRFVDDQ
jgi:hypothetical protein